MVTARLTSASRPMDSLHPTAACDVAGSVVDPLPAPVVQRQQGVQAVHGVQQRDDRRGRRIGLTFVHQHRRAAPRATPRAGRDPSASTRRVGVIPWCKAGSAGCGRCAPGAPAAVAPRCGEVWRSPRPVLSACVTATRRAGTEGGVVGAGFGKDHEATLRHRIAGIGGRMRQVCARSSRTRTGQYPLSARIVERRPRRSVVQQQ